MLIEIKHNRAFTHTAKKHGKYLLHHFGGFGVYNQLISKVNISSSVDDDWHKFVLAQKEVDLSTLIETEKLKPEETRRFVDNAFRDGVLKTTGTGVDKILPPVSRFGGGRAAKKQGVVDKLLAFFEKYFGLV